jgi:hypothetical protein
MAVSQTILERVYAKVETTFGTAVTLAGANFTRHTRCSLKAEQSEIPSSDKTGSISQTVGSAGTRGGSFQLDFEARPNGAAGVVPDCDPYLVGFFGQAGTVSAGTSVTYSLANATKSLTIGRYRQPSGVMQQVSIGSVIQQLRFAFQQQANCMITASGSSLWVPDSITFSALDSIGKGGLGAFPAEPGSPVSNGAPINGLTGTATLDGNTTVQIRAADLTLTSGIVVPRDRLFNGAYGSSPERDKLSVVLNLTIVDEDIAAVTNLYSKALSRTAVNLSLTAGSVAGAKFQFNLNNCILPMPALDDSARKWASNLSNIVAYPTTATSLDEVTLVVL